MFGRCARRGPWWPLKSQSAEGSGANRAPAAGLSRSALGKLASRCTSLSIAVIGDLFLDRYLEIDPALEERSLETGLAVHNVVRTRAEPGAAGAIAANLAGMGIGAIFPIGIIGDDAEGHDLWSALAPLPGVQMTHVIRTRERHTCTYVKPVARQSDGRMRELERLDFKNWTPTPASIVERLVHSIREVAKDVNGIVIMEQVERRDTGAITPTVLRAVVAACQSRSNMIAIADSRRGLADYSEPIILKMNAAEFVSLAGADDGRALDERVEAFAVRRGASVFVTCADEGIIGASRNRICRVPALPVRGPIDIVGAGDAVTAALTVMLAIGGSVEEACAVSMLAGSVVVHQLGTAGVVSLAAMETLCDLS